MKLNLLSCDTQRPDRRAISKCILEISSNMSPALSNDLTDILLEGDPVEIEKNNGLLWAKKIFKTKPNRSISEKFRQEIVTIFHHLTKEELIDKVLANYLINKNTNTSKESSSKNRNKN